MIVTALVAIWLSLLIARGTPIGRTLDAWLVTKPATILAGINRRAVLAIATLAAIAAICWWIMGHEGMVLVGFGLPELGMMFATIDLGIIVDTALLVAAGAATGGWQVMRSLVGRRRGARRLRRARCTRSIEKTGANDDDDRAPLPLAA